jgi:hypothetical protein
MRAPGGRRLAERAPRRSDRTSVLAVALVAVAGVAVLSAGRGAVAEDPAARMAVPVEHALDSCPRFDPPRGTRTTVVTAAAPLPGLGARGTIRYGEPGAELSEADQHSPARGELLEVGPGEEPPAFFAVEATGQLAAGLFTHQQDVENGSTLALSPCASPRAEWWFTGAGGSLDHTSELVLSNVDPGPAVVDVRVLGPEGQVDTPGTRGITIAPASRTTIPLADVAPQGEALAVHVVASQGRVVAALSDTFAPQIGVDPGAEWLPAAEQATRTVRLAGLPVGADTHTLVVANPTALEALVEVEISGRSGSFTPTENGQIRVPPETVVDVDITDAIGADASAVTLRSSTPVTATVRSWAGGDSTYAAPVLPLTGPSAAPTAQGGRSTVQLTADGEAATADVVAFDAAGDPVTRTTERLAPGTTASWTVPEDAAYVVVTPLRGRVHGAVAYASGAGVSQVPLRPLAVRLVRPAVRPVSH